MLGPIISLKVIGTRHVVSKHPEDEHRPARKVDAIKSDRPHFTMGSDLVGWGDSMVFLQYGETYRNHRKFHRLQKP